MEWIKIKIGADKKNLDYVSDIFAEAGIPSVEIEDGEEFLQMLEQTKQQWDFVEDSLYEEKSKAYGVSGYVPNTENGKQILKSIEEKINGGFEIFISVINEEDWAENWKKYFKPIPVGNNILICPVWEQIPEEYKSRTVFKIDPGMSFGTGTHETTRLCAVSLEKYLNPGDAVLDLGCGSGILSIIALLLGAKNADAVDIDENSARIAKENAGINNIPENIYSVYSGDLLTDNILASKFYGKTYDIILMNIIPGVIIPFLPLVKNLLSENGKAVLSGIIGRYLPDIENAVNSNGLHIIEETSENDWQCVVVIAGNKS